MTAPLSLVETWKMAMVLEIIQLYFVQMLKDFIQSSMGDV